MTLTTTILYVESHLSIQCEDIAKGLDEILRLYYLIQDQTIL